MSLTDDDCRRLMSLVAHELRSPGAVVSGYLRLLARNTGPGLSEHERKMIEEANKSCGRLLHIAQELSELYELCGGDTVRGWQPVQIFALCDQVVQAAAASGGAVRFVVDDRDKAVCVDGQESRLRQALGLLVQVIGREHGGSAMTVTGAVSRDHQSRAVLVFGEPADAADMSVVLASGNTAFDRWRGGTGLSLPIAHRIVEAHRGELWALPGGSRGASALALPLRAEEEGS